MVCFCSKSLMYSSMLLTREKSTMLTFVDQNLIAAYLPTQKKKVFSKLVFLVQCLYLSYFISF